MKRRSNTKRPHDPHLLYLDESLSGPAFASLLTKAGIVAHEYQQFLRKNQKIPDGRVINIACDNNCVLVTKDESMLSDWIQDIVDARARLIFITDQHGGPIHWAAALISSQQKWVRALLDFPIGPLVIQIHPTGSINKIVGEADLLELRQRTITNRIARAKRHAALRIEGTHGS